MHVHVVYKIHDVGTNTDFELKIAIFYRIKLNILVYAYCKSRYIKRLNPIIAVGKVLVYLFSNKTYEGFKRCSIVL